MIVTDIVEFDKKRSKIFIDGEFVFVLYKGELKDYNVKVGQELSESDYREILEVVLPKRAKLRAMNLLQKKDYTEKQLRDRLVEGLYPGEIVDEAIEYVKSYKYLNDERYARDYITYHMSTRSRARIIQDLTGKGISRDNLMSIIEELYTEDDGDAELDQIRRLLVKKQYDPEVTDFKEQQKITAFLMRKGYNLSDIKRAMEDE
jgi:regulatory protein